MSSGPDIAVKNFKDVGRVDIPAKDGESFDITILPSNNTIVILLETNQRIDQ